MKRRLSLVVIFCTLVLAANAQGIGVKGGLSLAKSSVTVGDYKPDMEDIIGFHAGLVGEIPLFGHFYLNTGLLYSQKGCEGYFGDSSTTDKLALNYLEIPVNLAYKIGVGPLAIFAQAGAYADYAISGKLSDVKIDFDEMQLDQFDYGVNVGAGVEVSIIQVSANYSFGLNNINELTDEMTIKNGVFSISAALIF